MLTNIVTDYTNISPKKNNKDFDNISKSLFFKHILKNQFEIT